MSRYKTARLLPQLDRETQRRLSACARLRRELARLVVELDELRSVVGPNLEALYRVELGAWELGRLEAEVAVRALKKRRAILQAAANRGQTSMSEAVDAAVEAELSAWWKQLDQQAKAVQQAALWLDALLSPEESARLKSLYRALVRRLHPDLNPDFARHKELWVRVREAYRYGDLAGLEALAWLLGDLRPGKEVADDPAAQHEQLAATVGRLRERIAALWSQPPFSLKARLEDEGWIAAERARLSTETERLTARAAVLGAVVAELEWQVCGDWMPCPN